MQARPGRLVLIMRGMSTGVIDSPEVALLDLILLLPIFIAQKAFNELASTDQPLSFTRESFAQKCSYNLKSPLDANFCS